MSSSHGDTADDEPRPLALIVDADEASRIPCSELLQRAGVHTISLATRR
jgi:hypothetical protein